MDVVESRSALLTNAEALQLLREAREANSAKRPKDVPRPAASGRNHSTLVYEAMKYLQESPASSQQRSDTVTMMQKARRRFPHLTAAELMQLANIRPRSLVEIQLIVEECEERMSEQEVEELIAIVAETLPEPKHADGKQQKAMPLATVKSEEIEGDEETKQ